jgi:hypothetical protein
MLEMVFVIISAPVAGNTPGLSGNSTGSVRVSKNAGQISLFTPGHAVILDFSSGRKGGRVLYSVCIMVQHFFQRKPAIVHVGV